MTGQTPERWAVQRTFDLPMNMEKRILRPRTSTKRSQACGHLVAGKVLRRAPRIAVQCSSMAVTFS